MYKPLTKGEMVVLLMDKGTLGAKAAAAIRHLSNRVAELMLAIAQDDKSGECATCAAGQNAAYIRELRRQNKQWQDDSDSWKLLSVKQVQEIVDLKLANERLEANNTRLREQVGELRLYVVHHDTCGCSTSPDDLEACNCGLNDALKEPKE